jgi:hypothetical protein
MGAEQLDPSSAGVTGSRQGLSRHKKILFASIVLVVCYSLAELVLTMLYLRGTLSPAPKSTMVLEQTGQGPSTRFDPVRGCFLAPHPARTAIVASNGTIETVGTVRGNNQGFPDRDDFQVERMDRDTIRYAVFGDSMTAAQFIEQNWPDMAEDLAGKESRPLELYNFSVFGGGLDNWRSVLMEHVETKGYELDGLVFAVCCDDLHRGFTFWDESLVQTDEQGTRWGSYGRMPSRNKLDNPANLDQASSFLLKINWQLLSSDEFESLIDGQTRLPFNREFKLYLTSRCVSGVARICGVDLNPIPTFPPINPACLPSMDEIAGFLRQHQLPCLVVQVPLRHKLLEKVDKGEAVGIPQQTQQFADRIGAMVVDGSRAFEGLDEAGIRECWLPVDGHWGQSGSDRFARFMLDTIKDWERNRAGNPR